MRLFSWCVFTCSRLYTQNDICNTRILSNPVEFYFFYQQQKFKLTVPLTQKDLRTPQAKAVQFRCCIGICKNKSFYVLHGYNNLYAPNLNFLEALIFNGEEPNQKELINFRGTLFTERGKCSQVRSQNEFQSLPLLLTKKAPQQRQKSFLVQFFFAPAHFHFALVAATMSHLRFTSTSDFHVLNSQNEDYSDINKQNDTLCCFSQPIHHCH